VGADRGALALDARPVREAVLARLAVDAACVVTNTGLAVAIEAAALLFRALRLAALAAPFKVASLTRLAALLATRVGEAVPPTRAADLLSTRADAAWGAALGGISAGQVVRNTTAVVLADLTLINAFIT
jgi:hypothetical protein